MDKKCFSRNFRYPSAELRDQIRAAVKERGFRSEQAFLIAACEHEIRQGANTEATEQFEARVAATLTNLAKQVQGLQTLAHAQVALTDVFLKYVITCVVEPPEDVLEEVLRVDPKSALALYYRALCLAKQGRLQEAEQDCRAAKANATEPGLKSVIEEMLTDIPGVAISDQMSAAIEHMNQGRWFPAVTELDTVLQIHPRCFNAYKYKALCLAEMEAKSVNSWNAVVKLPDKVPWAEVEAAVNAGLAQCLDEDTEVRKDLELWLSSLLQKRLCIYLNPAIQAINKGKWKKGLAYLAAGKQLHPKEVRFPQYEAICYLRSNDYKRAALCAKEAIKLCVDPNTKKEIENLQEAIRGAVLRRFIAAAEKHIKKEQWTEASAQMDQALRQYPTNALSLYYKAVCCMRLGDWETAGTLAEKAQKHTVDANLLSAITSLPPAIERGKAMALYREASAKFSVVMSKVNGERYDPYEFEFIHIQDLLNNASSHSVGEDLTDAIKRLSKNVSDIMSELDNMGRLHTGSGLGRFGL